MIIRDYMFWNEYVEGNEMFREMLYHEGGHPTYPDLSDADGTAEQFGIDCLADEDIREWEQAEVTYGQGGTPDTNWPSSPSPMNRCMVMIRYWDDTGEVIHMKVLYCY